MYGHKDDIQISFTILPGARVLRAVRRENAGRASRQRLMDGRQALWVELLG